MGRETQNVLLVLVGGALIKIVVDGTYLRYVAPWSGPVVLAGGIAVVALAAVAIVRDVRGTEPADDHGSRAAWMLMLPVLAILMVAPPALGSGGLTDAVARPVADDAAGRASEPLPPGDAPALAVVDFVARAAADPYGPLTGRDVTLTGFVAPGAGPGRTDLVRWVIACCAADAAPVRVHLAAGPAILPSPREGGPDLWIQVRGRLVAGTGSAADEHVPTLTVIESLPIASPDSVYEY